MPNRHPLRAAILGVAVVAALALVPVLSPLPAAADPVPDDGITIDVVVLGPTPAPTSTSTSTQTNSGGGSTQPDPDPTSPSDEQPGDDEIDLGGVLYIGGLRGSITPAVGARGGNAELSITVRNASDELADLQLRFWVKNGVGATIGEVSYVRARDLKPGETRRLSTTITTVGQWTFYTGHVTVTPPKELDGVSLVPITRDTSLAVPPYFLLILASAIAFLAFGIRALVRRLFGASQ